jgi:hypothetical protein
MVVQPELNESSTLFVRMDTKRVGNAVTAKLNGKKSFILNDNSNQWLTTVDNHLVLYYNKIVEHISTNKNAS